MPDLTLFLDDGGVLSDNARKGPEWRRLVGEFFSPRLGGEPRAWSEANRVMFDPIFEAYAAVMAIPDRYVEGALAYERAWLTAMCDHVGITAPAGAECAALAREAVVYITSNAQVAHPWTAEAVDALAAAGYTLHTASNQPSWEMKGYLEAMGLSGRFGILFGPDLVNAAKPAAAYYARAFVVAGVDPARALVLDDKPEFVAAARSVGARAVLVGSGEAPPGAGAVATLAELPALLAGRE